MEFTASPDITRLLRAWGSGDAQALEHLTSLVYGELRRIARGHMRRERQGNTLQTTALVNEAYLRLVDVAGVRWQDRAHFFAISAQMMRRILVDAARARGSAKRGGPAPRVTLDEGMIVSPGKDRQLLALDDALERLSQFDARKAKVIELRFFGGLSVEETAEVLQISPQSVLRDWKLAKAWLATLSGSEFWCGSTNNPWGSLHALSPNTHWQIRKNCRGGIISFVSELRAEKPG
jgi:RNA polymerase sigma-70 factor, ECF subfamily